MENEQDSLNTTKEKEAQLQGDKQPDDKNESCQPYLCFKLLKQVTLVGVWISLGMFVEVIGPTLVDLKEYVGVNYEQISRALVAKSVGFFIGSIFGGFLHERFYKFTDLIMSFGLMLGAFGITVAALVPSLSVVSLMLFLTGASEGFINTGGNTMVMHLWGEDAASPMCSLHLGFGIGAMVAPQLAKPFLTEQANMTASNSSTVNNTDIVVLLDNNSTESYHIIHNQTTVAPMQNTDLNSPKNGWHASNLAIPYGVVGCITTLFAIFMLIFFIVGPPKGLPQRKGTKNFRKLVNPAQCAFGHSCYGMVLLVLISFYFLQSVGGERAYGKYISAYSILNDVQFTKKQAADLATVFWLCHMGGRLSGTILTRFIPLSIFMAIFMTGSIIGSIVLAIFGHNTELILWIFTGLMGFTISLAFPSGMGWANLNMQVNSVAVMVFMMGGASGGFIYQYLPGYLFEYVSHKTLMYVIVAYAILLAVNFVIMEIVGRMVGKPIKDEYLKEKVLDEAEMVMVIKS